MPKYPHSAFKRFRRDERTIIFDSGAAVTIKTKQRIAKHHSDQRLLMPESKVTSFYVAPILGNAVKLVVKRRTKLLPAEIRKLKSVTNP